MSEINPYEPPQAPRPIQPGQIAKRGLGVAAILLLTPVAVGIAGLASCGATNEFVNANYNTSMSIEMLIVVGLGIFLIPPLATFIAMIWWAIRTHQRNKNPGQNDRGWGGW